MRWRFIAILLVIVVVIIFGFGLIEPASGSQLSARSILDSPPQNSSGFARAIDPWDWQFPRDHGAHPAFQTRMVVLHRQPGRRNGQAIRLPVHHFSPRPCANAGGV